jgi:pimeloyl-ACP methyl ester carboxylesterase
MTSVQQGTLRAPGASIFYRSCGRGRPVLILPGGAADADMVDPLRDALSDRYRVITFDRRGLSRSAVDPGGPAPTLQGHAADAHHLLAELTDEPAYVFGAGLGGLIGLDLLARHPGQVRLLVAHEAPTKDLLPDAAREAMADAQQAMLAALRREGVAAALKRSAELTGADPEDREPDVAGPAVGPQHDANMAFYLTHDLPQLMAYRLDLPALDVQARRIAPAAGQSSRRTLLHQCAQALAEALERPLAEFPGGHTGWLLRPKAFAARLAETFARSEDADPRLGDGVRPRTDGRP